MRSREEIYKDARNNFNQPGTANSLFLELLLDIRDLQLEQLEFLKKWHEDEKIKDTPIY